MDSPSPLDDNEAERDRQLAAELHLLLKERDQILAAAQHDAAPLFSDLRRHTKQRLKLAADHRDLQLATLRADFHVEVQQAWNEFERGKRDLRTDILAVSVDRRRRLDSVRLGAVAKKKKRARSLADRHARLRPAPRHPFLGSLERQGMVRIAATPDEVNNDLAVILHGIDSAKAHAPPRLPSNRPADAPAKSADKIHSSRGILHYHDITYEKGDRVSIFASPKPSALKLTLKYSGVLLAVNSKEILIRTDSGADHRVYVNHLRNGKFMLKPAGAANSTAS